MVGGQDAQRPMSAAATRGARDQHRPMSAVHGGAPDLTPPGARDLQRPTSAVRGGPDLNFGAPDLRRPTSAAHGGHGLSRPMSATSFLKAERCRTMAEGMSAHKLFEKCSPMGSVMQLDRGLPVVRLSATDGAFVRGQCSRLSSQQQVEPMPVGVDPRGLPPVPRPATAVGHFDTDCTQIRADSHKRNSSEGRLARPTTAAAHKKRPASIGAVGKESAKEPQNARQRAASTGNVGKELGSFDGTRKVPAVREAFTQESGKDFQEGRARRERSITPVALRMSSADAAASRQHLDLKRPHSAVRSPMGAFNNPYGQCPATPPSSIDTPGDTPLAPRGFFTRSSSQASLSLDSMNCNALSQPIRDQEPQETELLPIRVRPNGVVSAVAQKRHYHPSRWGRLDEMFKNKGGPHWTPTLPGGGASLMEKKNYYSMVSWPESKLGPVLAKRSAAAQDCALQPWE